MKKKKEDDRQIMSAEEQRFMAQSGLLQWTDAAWRQASRTYDIYDEMRKSIKNGADERKNLALSVHAECHFFVVAAWKVIDYRDWTLEIGLFSTDLFSGIDRFDRKMIKDIRDMREHDVDYFRGKGHAKDRWLYSTRAYSCDASSLTGTMIGGRLDYLAFGIAARRLHSAIVAIGFEAPAPWSATMR